MVRFHFSPSKLSKHLKMNDTPQWQGNVKASISNITFNWLRFSGERLAICNQNPQKDTVRSQGSKSRWPGQIPDVPLIRDRTQSKFLNCSVSAPSPKMTELGAPLQSCCEFQSANVRERLGPVPGTECWLSLRCWSNNLTSKY